MLYLIYNIMLFVASFFSDLSYLIFTLEKKLKEVNLWQGDVKFIPCYKHSYFLNHSTKFNQISNSNWKFVWANVDISVYITRSVVHCVALTFESTLVCCMCISKSILASSSLDSQKGLLYKCEGKKWVTEHDMTFFDKTGARKEKANIYTSNLVFVP